MAKTSKFEGVDFSTSEVHEATHHLMETLGGGFRCIRPEFVTFWKRGKIARECNANLCRCWIIHQDGVDLCSYITLLTDKLVLSEPALADEEITYKTFPAIKIGWLASDKRAKGAGKRLVDWAMEYVVTELVPRIGVRFMTVDAFYDPDTNYDASGFYLKLGFRFVDPDEPLPPPDGYRTMYFDLKPLIDAILV